MKIVNRTTFLAMPAGTIFSKFEPHAFGDIAVKGESLANDFYVASIADAVDCESSYEFFDILDGAVGHGVSFAIDLECETRDGCFDEDQLFAVWEKADVQKLAARVNETMAVFNEVSE